MIAPLDGSRVSNAPNRVLESERALGYTRNPLQVKNIGGTFLLSRSAT